MARVLAKGLRATVFAAATSAALASGAGLAGAQAPDPVTGRDTPGPAVAAPPSAEALRAAAAEFDLGDRAFERGEHDLAATHFEAAFEIAPHPDALDLAIRSRTKAGHVARAATLAALAVERYPGHEALATLAQPLLARAASQLHALTVSCAPACALVVDGRVAFRAKIEGARIFLEPGAHTLDASWEETQSRRTAVTATAGNATEVALRPPPRSPDGGLRTARAPEVASKPFPPWVFFTALGVSALGAAGTGISAGVAIASPGAEAVRARCRGLGTACPEYQRGEDGERRTNVLLAGTLASAAVTALVGLVLTDWRGRGEAPVAPSLRAHLGAGATGLGLAF